METNNEPKLYLPILIYKKRMKEIYSFCIDDGYHLALNWGIKPAYINTLFTVCLFYSIEKATQVAREYNTKYPWVRKEFNDSFLELYESELPKGLKYIIK